MQEKEINGRVEFTDNMASLRAGLDSNVIVWVKPKSKDRGWRKTNYTVKAGGNRNGDICFTYPVKLDLKNNKEMILDHEVIDSIYKRALNRSMTFLQKFSDLKRVKVIQEYEGVPLFSDPNLGGIYSFEVDYDCKCYVPPVDFDLKLMFKMFISKPQALEIMRY